ncbi:MAG TPA: type II toxin-antitoxin system HicB family antitoxin [Beijerinckiaceae bacterium]|jgi:predicted RNase H-like HicB family nuclease|nr:type II toxin-antitoxin system HicB family antitoxin [Beijerinckiaceae bacterium]
MNGYWALIHKDERSAYGVSFPDVPGCISAGDTLEEALAEGREALSAHLAWLKAEGDAVPEPRAHDVLQADTQVIADAEGASWHLIVPRAVKAPRVRVNIMVDPGLLREADEAADAQGLTRSGIIEAALRDMIGRPLGYIPNFGTMTGPGAPNEAITEALRLAAFRAVDAVNSTYGGALAAIGRDAEGRFITTGSSAETTGVSPLAQRSERAIPHRSAKTVAGSALSRRGEKGK